MCIKSLFRFTCTMCIESGSVSTLSRHTQSKVQVNFDIPVFEGQIDAYALEKWLNML